MFSTGKSGLVDDRYARQNSKRALLILRTCLVVVKGETTCTTDIRAPKPQDTQARRLKSGLRLEH